MRTLLQVILISVVCSAGTGCSRAADIAPDVAGEVSTPVNVVPVGRGSYASNVPLQAREVTKDFPERDLYILNRDRPIPTNQWWTNLIVDKYAGRLWAFPHQVEANTDGINLTFPTRWNDEGRDPISEFPLRIGGENFKPADARAKEWGDWTLTFRLAENETKFCDVTLGRGIPAVWLEYSGVSPVLRTGANATFFDESGAALTLPATGGVLGLEYGNRSYGVFAPPGTKFSQHNNEINIEFTGAKSYLVICPLTQKKRSQILRSICVCHTAR